MFRVKSLNQHTINQRIIQIYSRYKCIDCQFRYVINVALHFCLGKIEHSHRQTLLVKGPTAPFHLFLSG